MPEKEKGGSGVVEKKDQEIQIRLVIKDFFENKGSSTLRYISWLVSKVYNQKKEAL